MKVLSLTRRPELRRRLENALGPAHFVLDVLDTTEGLIDHALGWGYSGVLLDVETVGFRKTAFLVSQLRRQCPSIALFAVERYLDLSERLGLFEAGIDECLREPFFVSELAVRLSLLIRLRKGASESIEHLRAGDLDLDLVRRQVRRADRTIELRPKEFLLLEYLTRNANRPVTRSMILENVWHSSFEGLTNVVDVYISGLRSKVDRHFDQKLIQTERGVGYKLVCPEVVPMRSYEMTPCFQQAG
jgi:two-component system OmpR family response regulator